MKKYILSFFLCLCFLSTLYAAQNKKSVCLNMIVKNESKVIKRCLKTTKPLIDYWVIVDTGSSDGTQDIIKKYMKDIPGELYERPWVNFEHNRNEALRFAKNKADYTLMIDADEQFLYEEAFKLPPLNEAGYYFITKHGFSEYKRIQLINNRLPWKWTGVLHEYLSCSQPIQIATLEGIKNLYGYDGCRSQDPEKFKKDAQVFEEALKKEPHNARYVFYLAQSYKDAGMLEKAIENYEKRAKMGEWDQEVYWSLYQIGCLQEHLHLDPTTIQASYYKAYNYRPSRIEALHNLARLYRTQGNYLLAYLHAEHALSIPLTTDTLMVEKWMTDYGLLLELSISAFYIEHYDKSKSSSLQLLTIPDLPENFRTCVQDNLKWIDEKMKTISS